MNRHTTGPRPSRASRDYTLVVASNAYGDRYRRWIEAGFDVSVTALDTCPERVPESDVVLSPFESVPVVHEESLTDRTGHEESLTDRTGSDLGCVLVLSTGLDTESSTFLGPCVERVSHAVDRTEFCELVAGLFDRARYDVLLSRYAVLASRCGELATDSARPTARSDELASVHDRLAAIHAELDRLRSRFDVDDFDAAFEMLHAPAADRSAGRAVRS